MKPVVLRFLTAIFCCWLAVIAAPLSASPSGGDDDSGAGDLKWHYSQSRFVQLQAYQVRDHYGIYNTRGKIPKVDGFSKNMVAHLLTMANATQRRTFRLIKDLQRLKDPKKRLARLQNERRESEKLIKNLEASIERLEKQPWTQARNTALHEERTRLYRESTYLKSVKIWEAHPHEGTN